MLLKLFRGWLTHGLLYTSSFILQGSVVDRHGIVVNGVTSCVTSERDDVVCGDGWGGVGSGHRCTGQVGIADGKVIYQLNGERPSDGRCYYSSAVGRP